MTWRAAAATRLVVALGAVAVLAARGVAHAESAETPAAIRAIVESGQHPTLRWPRFPDLQPVTSTLYESLEFQPLWLADGKPTAQAEKIIATFATADADGLNPADYDAGPLATTAQQLAAGDAAAVDQAAFDTALTVSLMRYATALHSGRVAPHTVGFALDNDANKMDMPALVIELAHHPDPAARLSTLVPPFPVYQRLKEALAELRALSDRPDLPTITIVPKLHPGESDAEVPVLRQLLLAYGDLPPDSVPPNPRVYDHALVQAMKRFQRRHGLDPDGVIGKGTLSALQIPIAKRIEQVQLAMERLRWLPHQFGDRFIIVNVPEFRLRAYEGSQPEPQLVSGVVVGEAGPEHETPIMTADMRYLVFRPYWDVPTSIVHKEILPKLEQDPSYLQRQNMEMVNGRYRQKPGPKNSLGLLKFMLPNPNHVYLHDTPSKTLFARSRRDFSHGCIRVADPVGLAEFALRGSSTWNREQIESAMREGRDNRHVMLPQPIPVYIVYSTVRIGEDGERYFFDDIYGHDETLKIALAKGYPYPYYNHVEPHHAEPGP